MFKNLVNKRRSVRHFKDEKLKKEDIYTILDSALKAPTAKNRNPIHYIVIEDKNTLKELSNYKATATPLGRCVCAIAVLSDLGEAPTTYRQDASIAATFIQLQAEDLGINTCWINVNNAVNKDGVSSLKIIRNILSIPENYDVECIIAMGYGDEEVRERKLRKIEDYVHFEKF